MAILIIRCFNKAFISIDIDKIGRATASHEPTGLGGKQELGPGPKELGNNEGNGSGNQHSEDEFHQGFTQSHGRLGG